MEVCLKNAKVHLINPSAWQQHNYSKTLLLICKKYKIKMRETRLCVWHVYSIPTHTLLFFKSGSLSCFFYTYSYSASVPVPANVHAPACTLLLFLLLLLLLLLLFVLVLLFSCFYSYSCPNSCVFPILTHIHTHYAPPLEARRAEALPIGNAWGCISIFGGVFRLIN